MTIATAMPRWLSHSRASTASVILGMVVGLSLVPSPLPYLFASAIALLCAPSWSFRAIVITVTATVGWTPWPVPALIGAISWALLSGPDLHIRHEIRPSHSRSLMLLIPLAIAIGFVTVALSWDRIGGDASPVMPFPRQATWAMLALVAALSALNAIAEEAFWRVAILSEQTGDHRGTVLTTQALSFGLAHWAGLPYGIIGVVASALFSAGIVILRHRLGLLNALLVHWVVDVVIFSAVFLFAIYPPT